ncbi:hypothetical protein SPIRO4BDMA_40338 [uncultured spirochete]|jgi:hypothetical protein|uniref:Uncharacterized protein n=1 Tax=uncultured spirochete TaxID=156406 RepID=A0A3P3XP08_9SPIR|nr:hypothetical protein SPIRO4BDMA_40338 [uncultured spirochete]
MTFAAVSVRDSENIGIRPLGPDSEMLRRAISAFATSLIVSISIAIIISILLLTLGLTGSSVF